jgi:hypothetical protein
MDVLAQLCTASVAPTTPLVVTSETEDAEEPNLSPLIVMVPPVVGTRAGEMELTVGT